jgi:ParB-like chromosome segregation protein Spo0J
MTLLTGAATYEACLEEKETKVPAVIVQTDGEADDLMFALQSSELNETLSAIAAGAAIVRLIDSHNVPRKHIIEALGKSPAWLNKMEGLNRRLNSEVQRLVAEGQVPARSAQEIARLPDNVQMAFAASVCNDCLSKDNVAYLVNRYLNEDTGPDERDRIVSTPKLALPNELKRRRMMGRDDSVSARLSRAIAGCLDGSAYLCKLLTGADISGAAVRMEDVEALIDSLAALQMLLMAVFYPGKNDGGGDAYG